MDELEATQQQETAPAAVDNSQAEDAQGGFDQNAEGAIPEAAQQAQAEDTFLANANLDPTKLPPEIQPIFKRMQGAYTKRMQEIARVRDQAGIVERFYNDRDFAFQTVAQWAAQNGYQIAPVGQLQQQAQPTYQQQKPGQPDPRLVETIKANLPPELQWMAESQAPAIQQAVQAMIAPLVEQITQTAKSTQQQVAEREWDTLADELSNVAPGWEEHEGEMSELFDFLQSPQMKHPKFGSKHQILYDLVTKNAASTAQVAKRFTAAAKNRPASSVSTGRTVPNMAEQIRKAKTNQDAFRLAAQAAGFNGE